MQNPADAMPFSRLMGVQISEASETQVIGTLIVTSDLCTMGDILHGGAVMAFADALGAVGAFAALPEGAIGTTTIESKTNFLAAAPVGQTLRGVATPVSLGKRVSVWKTEIFREDRKQVALVTQTQLVLR